MTVEPILFTEEQAAAFLQMSQRTFRRERIPAVKFKRENARMKRWHIETLRSWCPSSSSAESEQAKPGRKPPTKPTRHKSGSEGTELSFSEALEKLQSVKRSPKRAA